MICLIGDGGLQFSAAELRVARDENLPVTFVVWNNAGYREIAEAMTAAAVPVTGCTPSMPLFTEETFGPVAAIARSGSFEEALQAAAAGDHGLAATVLTESIAHANQAAARLPVGTVKINAVFGGAPGGSAEPRGLSGTGFGYGPRLLDEMTQLKVVHLSEPGGEES